MIEAVLVAVVLAGRPAVPPPATCLAMKPEPCLAACEKGDDERCADLAMLAEQALLPRPFHERLVKAADANCRSHEGKRCFVAGVLLLQGIGVEKNAVEATKHFSAACEAGDSRACNNLAVRYARGDGVAKDEAMARRLAVSTCESWPRACLNAAYLIGTGVGGAADRKAGEALLVKTCTTFAPACEKLANDLIVETWLPRDVDRATRVATEACGRNDPGSCELLGKVLLGGVPEKKNVAAALPVLEKACSLGSGLSCHNLAVISEEGALGVPATPARVASLEEKGCLLGDQRGCSNFALHKLDGRGVKKDVAGGVALLERSCDSAPRSCLALGVVLAKGRGAQKNVPRAIEFFKRACGGGLDDACVAERQLSR